MMPQRRIVLASSSSIRATLLRNAGLTFDTAPVRVDEEAIRASLVAEGASPRDVADVLAETKALRASVANPDALVLGADQVLSMDNKIFAKAETPTEAVDVILALAGRTHHLHSALVAVENGRPIWRHIGHARITFHALRSDEIARYVTAHWDHIRHSVGCYRLEAEGVRLIAHTEGDHFTILGLPLLPLLTWMRVRGEIAAS